MNLSFDSLDELESIIAAMGYVKRESVATITQGDESISGPAALVLHQIPDPESGDDEGNESAPTEQPEQPKRKRRTKAEMEAARNAAEDSDAGSAGTSVDAVTPTQPGMQTETPTNPFEANAASPTTQAILNAPNQQAATLAGIAAMRAQSPFDAQTAEANTAVTPVSESASADAGTFIEQRALEILSTQTEPLTAVKHMHFCRDFIAKHKQEKYLQGFALAGLPSAIGAYKAEQCARHQAALEFLELN